MKGEEKGEIDDADGELKEKGEEEEKEKEEEKRRQAAPDGMCRLLPSFLPLFWLVPL